MPNAWFRMYAEFADDPKVQILSEAMQRRLTMLFCMRCSGKQIGTFRETEIAFKLRISAPELTETKAVFLDQGFIDDEWNILNWDKRQYLSDSSTDRVRKYRQGKKQYETLHETHVTEYETVPDTDTEQKQIQKKQKTTPKPKASVDERFTVFRKDFESDFSYQNRVNAPWDAKEASGLSRWLKANPTVTQEQWRTILRNRRGSPLNNAAPLSTWIGKGLSWLSGTADEWGKPLKEGGNNGKSFDKGIRSAESVRRHIAQHTGDEESGEAGLNLALFGAQPGDNRRVGGGVLAGAERLHDGTNGATGGRVVEGNRVLAISGKTEKVAGDS